MKIFAISDLHLSLNCDKPMHIFGPVWDNYWDKIVADWLEKVSEEDIVLIAGDISWAMKLNDAVPDLEIISKLPGTKVIIRGNHDYWWQSISALRNVLPNNMFALQNDSVKIGNAIFCGTRGWTVPEGAESTAEDLKLLNRESLRLDISLSSTQKFVSEKTSIYCMIHYPPFNSKLENSVFTSLIEKYNVKKVIYGHLHGKNSRSILFTQKNGVDYFLTSCDKLENNLTLIDEID